MFRKKAEETEKARQVPFMLKAVEQAITTKLDKESKEDAATEGNEIALQDRQETVTKVSAAKDIEFYDKVGCAVENVRLKRKLNQFGK